MVSTLRHALVAVAAAALVIALTAGPAPAAPQDHVAGSGVLDSGSRLTVQARGDQTDVSGTIRLRTADSTLEAEADCLNVVGSVATLSGRTPPGLATQPHVTLVTIEDNGSSADLAGVRTGTGLITCGAPVAELSPVDQGNVTVNGP